MGSDAYSGPRARTRFWSLYSDGRLSKSRLRMGGKDSLATVSPCQYVIPAYSPRSRQRVDGGGHVREVGLWIVAYLETQLSNMWPARECSSWMSAAATIRIVTADDTLRWTTTTRTTSLFCTGDEVHDAVNGQAMCGGGSGPSLPPSVSVTSCVDRRVPTCNVPCRVCVAQHVP